MAKANSTARVSEKKPKARTDLDVQDEREVDDDASTDDTVAIESYDITSFGADYDVEGLVKRLNRNDIFIPPFQRDYVWNMNEASRFIESLLLGLPVPGIFLAREQETNKLLVIDGQQRLKTLQFFYNGYFNPKKEDKSQKVFTLTRVQPKFDQLRYDTLEEKDRLRLNDSIIHATIVKQESPDDNDTSIYYIFERLNNGGQKLTPQEIRVAIYHGRLLKSIKQWNAFPAWRTLYGKQSPRLKDQELILRFLAFYENAKGYNRPMSEFINRFAMKYRNAEMRSLELWGNLFKSAITLLSDAVGKTAFRPESTINAAIFDSVMVGLCSRMKSGPIKDTASVKAAYSDLLSKSEFMASVSRSTADVRFVATRIKMATETFAKLA